MIIATTTKSSNNSGKKADQRTRATWTKHKLM